MNSFLEVAAPPSAPPTSSPTPSDMAAYLTDWRKRFTGSAAAIVKPGSTEEVAAIVRLCNTYRVPIVPQGGNTGLVLGSVPDESGQAIVLSLTRMHRVRAIDSVNNTITVEAGCILENIQNAAAEAARLFPLSLAAEGSCTIGGNLSTNAGGTARAALRQYPRTVPGPGSRDPARRTSGTACAACARITPATICATSTSAPKARSASSPPRC